MLETGLLSVFSNFLGFFQTEFFEIALFFILKYLMFFAATMVIISSNPLYSIFYLILLFINVAFLIITLGVEFLGIMFIVVYVGAIAVLFLFVVMMLNINHVELYLKSSFGLYFLTSLSLILFFTIILNFYVYQDFYICNTEIYRIKSSYVLYNFSYKEWISLIYSFDNALVLGSLLYTFYYHLFIIVGFILLVAMVGSIVLTLNPTRSTKFQDKHIQVSRTVAMSVSLRR
jgi:NADH-quinone oxidoreductase subunit J